MTDKMFNQIITQIKIDIANNDLTAIEELLLLIPEDRLKKYLELD